MTIFSPADPGETRHCVGWLSRNPGPSYLRLGKAGEKPLHNLTPDFDSPLQLVDRNANLAIVATGAIVAEALTAAAALAELGFSVDVFSMTRLTSLQEQNLSALRGYHDILTIEEHVAAGGLGELLRAMVSVPGQLRSLCVPETLSSAIGSQTWLRSQAGLDAIAISKVVVSWRSHGGC